MDRRKTLQWMLGASAAVPFLRRPAQGAPPVAAAAGSPPAPATAPEAAAPETATEAAVPAPAARGYGTDPDLLRTYRAGDAWPLTLTPAQRRTATALCDAIIPADEQSPAASAVGVVDFIDEWVSAPYPSQREDRATVLEGLAWIDGEAAGRFGRAFADLGEAEQHALCDDLCDAARAAPRFAAAAAFFALYRDLTADGFYSTPEGRRDVGYIGNVPRATFEAPPPELLRRLGLA